MPKKRVLIIANKWWECDPIMNALLNDYAHPASALTWPDVLNHPRRRPTQKKRPPKTRVPVPRAVFSLTKVQVEVWCISDLLEHLPEEKCYQSSAERKIERLPKIFAGRAADLVVAIGTAAFPGDVCENGNVIVGTKIFMLDAHPNGTNPYSKWNDDRFDKIITSPLDRSTFMAIASTGQAATNCFLVPPLNAAAKGSLLADYDYADLGTVNVTDDKEYAQKDLATLNAYLKYDRVNARSLETTHGLIRVQSEAPFIFVSGIANRMGRFEEDVKGRLYAQNTTAAHNAGIVLAQMIPKINSLF
jgi:hypothetical protein